MQTLRARQGRKCASDKVAKRVIQHICELTVYLEPIRLGWLRSQNITIIYEGEKRFQFMIAVIALYTYMQREIDFGECNFFDSHAPALAGKIVSVR
jgi:hypothetical protein